MRFLLDAQLPARLARSLVAAGHDALHTSELPDGDASPRRLLVVRTGNTSNAALLALFEDHDEAITAALQEADFVELGADTLVVHRRQ